MTIEVNNVFPNQDLRLIVDGELKQVSSSESLLIKKLFLLVFLERLPLHVTCLIYLVTLLT